jgi:hypothetical protein
VHDWQGAGHEEGNSFAWIMQKAWTRLRRKTVHY